MGPLSSRCHRNASSFRKYYGDQSQFEKLNEKLLEVQQGSRHRRSLSSSAENSYCGMSSAILVLKGDNAEHRATVAQTVCRQLMGGGIGRRIRGDCLRLFFRSPHECLRSQLCRQRPQDGMIWSHVLSQRHWTKRNHYLFRKTGKPAFRLKTKMGRLALPMVNGAMKRLRSVIALH